MKNVTINLTMLALLSSLSAFAHGPGTHGDEDQKELKYLNTSNISNIHTGRYEIALTIDDGPTKGVTDRVLNILKKYKVKATFFVTGKRVTSKKKYLLKRMLNEGHLVGNHTYNHPTASTWRSYSNAQKQNEFVRAHNATAAYSRNADFLYFRAPGGYWTPNLAKLANSTRIGRDLKGPILWDIGGSVKVTSSGVVARAADWDCWSRRRNYSVKTCLQGYINETKAKRGGVALFHDLKSQTASLLEAYIKYFKNAGYTFVTLNDVNLR